MENIQEKKMSKKDRHSKIVTSQGLRDRRMRLSLEVAPKFFNLQEMLGFDKGSHTLEWLLDKSQWAIMELSRNTTCRDDDDDGGGGGDRDDANNTCNTSKCDTNEKVNAMENEKTICCPNKKKKKERAKVFDKISREKARERARERTCAKNKLLGINESQSPSSRMLESTHS